MPPADEEKLDVEVAALKRVAERQGLIDSRIGVETLATTEGQASLRDLHDACVELVGVPSALQAAAAVQQNKKGDEGAEAKAAADKTVDMLAVAELTGLSQADERTAVLTKIAQISMLDPPPFEADILQGQLDFVSDREAYWAHQQVRSHFCSRMRNRHWPRSPLCAPRQGTMENFYQTLDATLWCKRHQFEQRWLRFCSSSEARRELGGVYDTRLANIDSAIAAAELRVHQMQRHAPLDEKRLRSEDLRDYHRHASHARSVNTQITRESALIFSLCRSGCAPLVLPDRCVSFCATRRWDRRPLQGDRVDGAPLWAGAHCTGEGAAVRFGGREPRI